MSIPGQVVHGAVYSHDRTGERVRLEGLRSRTVLVTRERDGEYEDIPHADFSGSYSDTGEHDHELFCCSVHESHTVPHRGCIFR